MQNRGFSLIELMMAVAIAALLASVALPGYTQYVVRSRRVVAQGDLVGAAGAMERHFTLNGTYAGAAAGTTFHASSPAQSGDALYRISIQSSTAAAFTLRAEPVAGSSQARDGMLQIDHLDNRAWDRNGDGDFLDAKEQGWER